MSAKKKREEHRHNFGDETKGKTGKTAGTPGEPGYQVEYKYTKKCKTCPWTETRTGWEFPNN